MDIVQTLQKEVDKIAKKEYEGDQCPPSFLVSLLFVFEGERHNRTVKHQIALTIQHNGAVFTDIIFPTLNNKYGYPDLKEEMKELYNRTM